jgi:hypothetical protein
VVSEDLENRAPALVRQRMQDNIHEGNVTVRVRTRQGT